MEQKQFEELSGLFFRTGQLFSELGKDIASLNNRIDNLEYWCNNLQSKTDKQKTVLLQIRDCITSLEGE